MFEVLAQSWDKNLILSQLHWGIVASLDPTPVSKNILIFSHINWKTVCCWGGGGKKGLHSQLQQQWPLHHAPSTIPLTVLWLQRGTSVAHGTHRYITPLQDGTILMRNEQQKTYRITNMGTDIIEFCCIFCTHGTPKKKQQLLENRLCEALHSFLYMALYLDVFTLIHDIAKCQR